jgi:NADH-quinone oxidoreductase subunit E
MSPDIDIKALQKILGRHPHDATSLIQVLQDVQLAYNYLPETALKLVSSTLSVPLSKVYSVATFYKAFSMTPKGKKVCRVCMGTACHIRGAKLLMDELERRLEIKAGETTPDMAFTLESVNCVGACAMAPVIMMNEAYHSNVQPDMIKKILDGKK